MRGVLYMKKYSRDFYKELYEYNSSNLSVIDFCKIKEIAPSTFYKNRNTNNQNDLIDITDKVKSINEIRINLKSMEIIVNESTDLHFLKKVISGLN